MRFEWGKQTRENPSIRYGIRARKNMVRKTIVTS